ncbi:SMU1112c/YaeR family gloxylase I-like metalloprotein [Clostridium saccharoperbutylacetonicum]
MKFDAIHHIAIITSDYEVSKHFYVNILGFEIIRENYRKERNSYKLDLKIGTSEIELFSMPNAPKRPSYPEACGLRHLAFRVENIEKIVEELNMNGIITEPIRIDEYTGKKFTFFSDPDGLPLELHE